MKILLVDDETLARDRLRRLLESKPEHEVVGEAANGIEAVKQCATLQPDLVLLDIRMPGMDGLETARHFSELESPPGVIFCTAYEEHAVQAFDLQAVGYLLKPVRRENLFDALLKSVKLNRAQITALQAEGDGGRSHLSARTHKGVELIPIEDVRYLQADQKYVTVRYRDGEVIIDESLRDLEVEFGDRFVRVHRNALISHHFIEGLVKDNEGQMCIQLNGTGDLIEVSRRHLPAIRKLIKTL
ncbi:MAG: LytTR family DNA-binding domain-containing protein [Pseudomonadales bacterium]|nr:LytTR family DNA-binding domain-containing protein [Pseudomonadales bacterium]